MTGRKIVLITLFVMLLGIVGGMYYFLTPTDEKNITSPLQPQPEADRPPAETTTPPVSLLEADTEQIKTLVNQFYRTYTECLKNPPREARGRVSVYCQEHTGLTTEAFAQNLKDVGTARAGADPVMCSQNPVSSISAETVEYEDATRAIATALSMSRGSAQKIPVLTLKEGSDWKVDSVICPRP